MRTNQQSEHGYDSSRNVCLSELPDAIYWPFERLPETKLDTYAVACVETALLYSEDARTMYAKVVQSWELPGCQTLIGDFARCKQDTRVYLRDRANAAVKNDCPPAYPDSWLETIRKVEGNTDCHLLLKCVAYFVENGFNRKEDLVNQTPKVTPGESPYLDQAIVSCSLLDYLDLKPGLKGPGVMPESELAEFRWFCRTLANKAITRPSRQVRRTLKQHGFNLQNHQTIVDGAEMWYRARVLNNTARGAADYYRIDSIDLSKRIEPYDDATGWPRHR